MGRALMAHPKVLLTDEPSMRLAPFLCPELRDHIQEAATTMFVVEHKPTWHCRSPTAATSSRLARSSSTTTAQGLLDNPQMRQAYLGEV